METSARPKSSDPRRAAAHHERGHGEISSALPGAIAPPSPVEIVARYLKGEHRLMADLRIRIARHVGSRTPLLITGETGTGKQLVARALHAAGPMRGRSIVIASVGTVAPSLAQSELFGHRRGAFTGAERERKGLFVEARGSTLLLDDIPDYSPALQAMLLNAVEYGLIRAVGSDLEQHSNARIVATSNRCLRREVAAGRFREDLYYRLSGGEIVIPPLRDHVSDLELYAPAYLLEHALAEGKAPRTLDDGALNVLCEHSWPGNIRELHNVLSRALHGTDSPVLAAEHIRMAIRGAVVSEATTGSSSVPLMIPEPEDTRIRRALEGARWNVTRAARALGYGRTRMYELMAKHGISR